MWMDDFWVGSFNISFLEDCIQKIHLSFHDNIPRSAKLITFQIFRNKAKELKIRITYPHRWEPPKTSSFSTSISFTVEWVDGRVNNSGYVFELNLAYLLRFRFYIQKLFHFGRMTLHKWSGNLKSYTTMTFLF